MMREIKFRAWDIDKNEMTFFDLYALSCCEDYLYGPLISGVSRSGKNLEIMQFTGLHDKNGKEIYEGDILNYGNYTDGSGPCNHVVTWKDGGFITNEISTNEDFTFVDTYSEVIGNIFENHEFMITATNPDAEKG